LYNSRLGHGDAIHLGDLNPNRTGLEVWSCFESSPYGAALRDAKTGEIIFRWTASKDTGRACSADILASSPGEEIWASGGSALFSCTGINLGSAPSQINHAIWWDGDDLRELLDGTVITKYGGGTLLSAGGCVSINGTKSNPCLQADILGDWREEVILPTTDSRYLRIYSTTAMTLRRLFTLMHDPVYRLGIAWQNVAYNQPPHVGFYLGDGMAEPAAPDIHLR
jgi:rhamnogalacturonan endolyase